MTIIETLLGWACQQKFCRKSCTIVPPIRPQKSTPPKTNMSFEKKVVESDFLLKWPFLRDMLVFWCVKPTSPFPSFLWIVPLFLESEVLGEAVLPSSPSRCQRGRCTSDTESDSPVKTQSTQWGPWVLVQKNCSGMNPKTLCCPIFFGEKTIESKNSEGQPTFFVS